MKHKRAARKSTRKIIREIKHPKMAAGKKRAIKGKNTRRPKGKKNIKRPIFYQ